MHPIESVPARHTKIPDFIEKPGADNDLFKRRIGTYFIVSAALIAA